MRKAYNDYGFIIEDDVFYGVSLGWDFTAEHEWGIEGLKLSFKIPELTKKTMGVKSRQITQFPGDQHMTFRTLRDYAFLEFSRYSGTFNRNERYSTEKKQGTIKIHHELKFYKDDIERTIKNERLGDPIITAWSSEDFGVVVKGKQESKWLEELYEAFKEKNVAIAFMNISKGPFANAALSLVIVDKLKDDVLEQMKEADQHALDIKKVRETDNFLSKLKKTGKFGEYSLHACSPRFNEYDPKNGKKNFRKENISYWINSSDFYGWCTVDEIKELINDKNLTVEQFKKRKENER